MEEIPEPEKICICGKHEGRHLNPIEKAELLHKLASDVQNDIHEFQEYLKTVEFPPPNQEGEHPQRVVALITPNLPNAIIQFCIEEELRRRYGSDKEITLKELPQDSDKLPREGLGLNIPINLN